MLRFLRVRGSDTISDVDHFAVTKKFISSRAPSVSIEKSLTSFQAGLIRHILCVLSFSGLLFTSCIASADQFKNLHDVDLPGHDILTPYQELGLRNIGLEACKNACAYNKKCKAFTYNRTARWCFLKGEASEPIPFSGAISGIRANAEASPPAIKPLNDKAAGEIETQPNPITETAFVHREQPTSSVNEVDSPAKIVLPSELSATPVAKQKMHSTKVAMNDVNGILQAFEPSYKTAAAKPQPELPSNPSTDSALSRVTIVPKTNVGTKTNKLVEAKPSGKQLTNNQIFENNPDQIEQMADAQEQPAPRSPQDEEPLPESERILASNGLVKNGDQPVSQPKPLRQAALIAPIDETQTQIPANEETAEPTGTTQTAPQEPNEPLPIPDRKPEFKQAAVKPAEPLLSSNKYAKYVHKKVGQSMYYASKANVLSRKYLAKYDAEKAGTKWVKSSSFGISIPMQATTSQAKALVLSNMGKDQRLEKYQRNIAYIRKQIAKPLENVLQNLPSDIKERLTKLRNQNDSASEEFRTARDRLKAWGEKLSRHANQTWKLPSGAPLKKLHDLAADMRDKRQKALDAGRVFSEALKEALERPVAVSQL